jgi:predicted metalloprotease with PDZ domain
MIFYQIKHLENSLRYIEVSIKFENTEESVFLQLPKWRPGRYELGNFAKNIRNFKAESFGKSLKFEKVNSHLWKIDASKNNVEITYQYFATDLNAGSTFSGSELLFINPVNCCMYVADRIEENISIEISTFSDFKIATSLQKVKDNTFSAKDFHELADSPILASKSLLKESFTNHDVVFNLWFYGIDKIEKKFIEDVEKYTQKQIEIFGDFPVKSYDYFFIFTHKRAYHGVEHSAGTAIYLGPSVEVFNERYVDLLGVSSHELFHTWNVKNFRDKIMMPYDYTQENYSKLGYIAEGITTFYGDWTLYRAGVYPENQFLLELTNFYQKYVNNFGRFNYSVAESSFDTWLDGYEAGAPNRKVSIYNEGALITFIIDYLIRKQNNNEKSLDDVLKSLYFDYGKTAQGYDEEIFKNILLKVSSIDFNDFFVKYINGKEDLSPLFMEALDFHGFRLEAKRTADFMGEYLGLKLVDSENKVSIAQIYPDSFAQKLGMNLGDEIIAIQNKKVNNPNLIQNYLKKALETNKAITLHCFSNEILKEFKFPLEQIKPNYFKEYEVVKKTSDNINYLDRVGVQ